MLRKATIGTLGTLSGLRASTYDPHNKEPIALRTDRFERFFSHVEHDDTSIKYRARKTPR